MSDLNAESREVRTYNKEISKAIRKNIKKYKSEHTVRAIKENNSLKIMKRKMTSGKIQIFHFYTTVYKSQENS